MHLITQTHPLLETKNWIDSELAIVLISNFGLVSDSSCCLLPNVDIIQNITHINAMFPSWRIKFKYSFKQQIDYN